MQTDAKKEHEWLQKFIGDWTATGEMPASADQPAMSWTTKEKGRAIGPLWIQAESESTMPDGNPATMQLTLGYDTNKQRFVGTWIGSMMDYLWIYDGELSADGRTITLNATGPNMGKPGTTAAYQDIHTFISDDHRLFTSQIQNENGAWQQIMEAHYYRQK